MVKLADTRDLKSLAPQRRAGSSPATSTKPPQAVRRLRRLLWQYRINWRRGFSQRTFVGKRQFFAGILCVCQENWAHFRRKGIGCSPQTHLRGVALKMREIEHTISQKAPGTGCSPIQSMVRWTNRFMPAYQASEVFPMYLSERLLQSCLTPNVENAPIDEWISCLRIRLLL